jgi:leader peptidase (prepilin peptidase)/N-methyltransferase
VTADPIVVAIAGVLGLVLGSFLNVCIARWGAEPKESVVRPRSRCPHCGHEIAWYDNVPVVSWLALRARCRGCGARISAQYPMVELATAAIWAYMAWRYGLTLEAARGAVFATILLGIAMTDARAYVIPHEFTLGGLVLGIGFAALGGWPALLGAVAGALAGFVLLWVVDRLGTRFLGGEIDRLNQELTDSEKIDSAMGGGDVMMMAMVGAFVGWQGVLLTIFLGAVIGTAVFLPVRVAGRHLRIPFGIFLALGALATWLVGPAIFEWYGQYLQGA